MKSTQVPSRCRSNALHTGDRPMGLGRTLLAAFAAFAATSAVARESRAEQFVLFDATFDYTWDNAINSKPSKSHFYVNEGNFLNKDRPKNWLTPVDYRNGTLHVRAEVISKPPGMQTVGWTLCYISSGGYGCADSDYYKTTGVFERDVKMTSFWNNTQVQWASGVRQMDLIYAINDSGSGHVHNYPNLKDQTTPTRVRITMIQVSAGSTYDPTKLNFADGGMPAPTSDAGANGGSSGSADAGTETSAPVATGGRSGGAGTGGASGAGGTGGVASSSGGGSTGSSGTGGSVGSTSTGGTTTAPSSGGSSGTKPSRPVSSGVSGGCTLAPQPTGQGALAIFALVGLMAAVRRRRR
ncbi:MAG TPA: MYXO-CTERM sorting domain-containing protein [Polyangia bacterium]